MERRTFSLILSLFLLTSFILFSQEERILTLIQNLKKPVWNAEQIAYYDELVAIGKPAVPYILKTFQDPSESYHTRATMAKLLGDIRAKEAVPVLVDFYRKNLKNYKLRGVRAACIYALGKMRDPSLLPIIREALKDPDGVVIQEAYFALKNFSRKEATEALLKSLEDPQTACDTIEAISDLKLREKTFPFDKIPEHLKKSFFSPQLNKWSREIILYRLSRIPSEEVLKFLIEIARSRGKVSDVIRKLAASAAGDLLGYFPSYFPEYLKLLKEEDNPQILSTLVWELNRRTDANFKLPKKYSTQLEKEMLEEKKNYLVKQYQKLWKKKHKKEIVVNIRDISKKFEATDYSDLEMAKKLSGLTEIDEFKPVIRTLYRAKLLGTPEVKEIVAPAVNKYISQVIQAIRNASSLKEKYNLLIYISYLEHPQVRDLYRELIRYPHPFLKAISADYLLVKGERDFLPEYLSSIPQETENAQRVLLGAILDWGIPEAEGIYRKLLDNPGTPLSVKLYCAYGLAVLNRKDKIPFILENVEHPERRYSSSALSTLEKLFNIPQIFIGYFTDKEKREARKELEGWWEEHQDKGRDDWLKEGFQEAGYKIKSLNSPDAVPELIRALGDNNPSIRSNAQFQLRKITHNPYRVTFYIPSLWKKDLEWWKKWWEENQKDFASFK